MGDQVWQVPQDKFVAVWNAAGSVREAAARIRELTDKYVPSWAVMSRAIDLRKAGVPVNAYPPMRGA